ncbi:MAG TPA: four helix bundle protein [Lacunisphaera sp.]|nr:four helix bundle protein [Lacunisphaera sp.]
MGTGFHDLRVWQDAKALAIAAYRLSATLSDFGLRDQIRRAAVSVPSNIAEGDERDSDKDCVRCFYIAKGSLAELRTQLEIASAVGALPESAVSPLLESAAAVGRQLGALIKARSSRAQSIAHRP